MVQKNNFYYSLHNCEDLKTTNPIRKIKEVLEWLYNTLYQKFIGNFHVILKLCFWWQCYKPLQDNKQIVCLFPGHYGSLWEGFGKVTAVFFASQNISIINLLYYMCCTTDKPSLVSAGTLFTASHNICRNTSITDCDLTLEWLQLDRDKNDSY